MYCKYISIIMLHCNKKVFISFYTKWTSIVTLLTKNHMSGSFKYAVYNKMKKIVWVSLHIYPSVKQVNKSLYLKIK